MVLIRRIHFWLAILLGLPLIFVSLSGLLLVVVREAPMPTLTLDQPRPISDIIEAASRHLEGAYRPALYIAPAAPGEAAVVRMTVDDRAPRGSSRPADERHAAPQAGGRFAGGPPKGFTQVKLDSVSLQVVDVSRPALFSMDTVRRLHTNLLVEGPYGRQFVGWVGVVGAVLGLSGLVLWRPNGRQQLYKPVAPGSQARRLHKTAGIWGFLALFVSAVTGLGLAFPEQVMTLIRTMSPVTDYKAENNRLEISPGQSDALSVDVLAQRAVESVPGSSLRMVAWPRSPKQPYRIALYQAGALPGAPNLTLFMDPWTGNVIKQQNPAAYTRGDVFMAWLRPLHEGQAFAWPVLVMVLFAGALPLFFGVTGVIIWRARVKQKRTARQEYRQPQTSAATTSLIAEMP